MGGPERLTHVDASFLYLERPGMPMHVGGVSVLDPSTRPDGRLPFEEVRRTLAARIHLAPRLRQRVLEVPLGLARPVWVDDERFDLDYHLRRAALPAPGGRAELADAVGRALSQPLDRTRPLWELHVFEGLEGGLAAVLLKVHHAMADGISVMRVAQAMFDLEPEPRRPAEPEPWRPTPPPSPGALVRDAVLEGLADPADALRRAALAPRVAAAGVAGVLAGAIRILGMGPPPRGPFDAPVGTGRRFAMADAPFERFRAIERALGGTVNDVVLTVVAGAIHDLLRARREPTRGRTLRVMVPVSLRARDERDLVGNRIAPAFVDVPVGPMSPRRRHAAVRRAAAHLRGTALGADAVLGLGALAPPVLLAAAARLVSRGRWFNVVVSNVPAPQVPVYLCGARLLASYPAMPLAENVALSIGCTSLAGTMAFGLTGDRDAMRDLDRLALAIEEQVEALAKAAGV